MYMVSNPNFRGQNWNDQNHISCLMGLPTSTQSSTC